MKKASFQKNHDEFEEDLEWYGELIGRILAAKQIIRYKDEKIELVEALVLRIASLWDVLVEEDLIDALNQDASQYARESGLNLGRHLSRSQCEAIIVGHRYLDFKSVGEVKKFAKSYLEEKHNPFRLIPKDCVKPIDQFTVTIRNYLSHYSSYSRRVYKRMLRDGHDLQRWRQPGDFLLATSERTGDMRLNDYLNAFFTASQEMRKVGS